jgi:hypothetical protein
MRTSSLMAGVFAVLIASGAAFAGGYLLGKEDGASAPAPVMDVARQDAELPDTPEQLPPVRDRGDQPEAPREQPKTPDVTPKAADKAKPAATTHDAGVDAPEPDAVAPAKPTNAPGTQPEAEKPIRDQIEDLRKRLEDGVALERLDPESVLGGPKVDFAATITGTVTDAAGIPIAGAEVRGQFSEQFNSTSGGGSFGFALARSGEGERLGTTDGGGQFRVEINRKVGEKAILRVALTANADGYAESTSKNVTLKNGETEEGVKLALRQAGAVTGRVVDQSGRGVPGVEVSLGSPNSNAFGGTEIRIGGESQLSATTDGGGEYRVDRVPEGRYRLQLSAKGYREVSGPSIVEAKPGSDTRAPADFVVEVTGTIRVALLGGPGVPLRKAFVQLQFKDAAGKVVKNLSSRTDDSGVAVINDPPVGTFDVVVKSWGYTSQTIPVTITEKLPCDLGTITLESSKNSDPLDLGD